MCVMTDWLASKINRFEKHECARLCGNHLESSGDKTCEQTRLTFILQLYAFCVKGV